MNLQERIRKTLTGLIKEENITLPLTISGSFQGDNADKSHAFQSTGGVKVGGMQTIVNAKLKEIYAAGFNPFITKITVTIDKTEITTSWEVTIDNSTDGKAYLGLITVGSCCTSTFKERADNQVKTMLTWNSKPENHKLITTLLTTDDGNSNGDITIIGGKYKLKQHFYQYSFDNKPAHKNIEQVNPETKIELIDPKNSQPADVNYVNLKEQIRKVLREVTENSSSLEKTVESFVNMNLSEYDLPENFHGVAVDIYPDLYGRQECHISMLFKKSFSPKDSDKMHGITNKIKKTINDYFGEQFAYISNGTSTIENYKDTKWWYDKKKNKNLNESKILKEDSFKQSLIQQIKDFGPKDTAELVGGSDNLFKLLNIESPMDFLHLFDDLDFVQSKEEKNWTLFRYKPKHNLMIYDRENEVVYIDYTNLWSFLRDDFGLNYSETQQVTKEWLSEVYNLKGVTTPTLSSLLRGCWMRYTI